MTRLIASIVLAICLMSIGTLSAQGTVLEVVSTTTILADVARNVGGDRVTVTSLVPPDADAHAFEPTPQDALVVSNADVVLAVGLGYEAFLAGLEENAERQDIVIVSDGIAIYPLAAGDHHDEPLGVLGVDDICDHSEHVEDVAATEEVHDDEHEHGGCDPHVWADPNNVMIWADNIASAFAAADPTNAEGYAANADVYKQQLQAADHKARQFLSFVPSGHRILITNHEFMNYFARAYDFQVAGVVIPGGTTGGEIDPRALAELIQMVKDLAVPAIFAEASASTNLIDTLAGDAGVQVVTALSESLTAEGGEASTYIDYLLYNAQTIATALGVSP